MIELIKYEVIYRNRRGRHSSCRVSVNLFSRAIESAYEGVSDNCAPLKQKVDFVEDRGREVEIPKTGHHHGRDASRHRGGPV